LAFVGRELNGDRGDGQRVTERNQLWRFLGGHDASDTSNRQDIAFRYLASDDHLEHGWRHPNGSNRKRFPLGDGLGGNVHHTRAALRINVTEFLHRFLNYRSTRGITS
jgi:hypothetical protein